MDRVQTLIDKLQNQSKANLSPEQLMITTQLLYAELMSSVQTSPKPATGPYVTTALSIPLINNVAIPNIIAPSPEAVIPDNEKVIEVLEVDEKEIEEELNQIKKIAETKASLGNAGRTEVISQMNTETTAERPHPSFNIYNKSVEDTGTLNDSLKSNAPQLSDKLVDIPVKDLKKAISINQRFVFINELFNGDEAMYEKSIKTINGFSIYPEAEYWIRRELKLKLGWRDQVDAVKEFDQLVRRRFM